MLSKDETDCSTSDSNEQDRSQTENLNQELPSVAIIAEMDYSGTSASFMLGFTSARHFHRAKIAGYTTNSSTNEVKIPPIIGAAMRFITSAPVSWLHMIGASPRNITPTVITLGRRRCTAPAITACLRSSQLCISPFSRRSW